MGGLKKGKRETLMGSISFLLFVFLWFSFNIFLNFHGTFKLVLCSGKFSSYSALFYSQSISDQFSAHVKPVIQYIFISLIYIEYCYYLKTHAYIFLFCY